jgi:hypothetical protein
VRDFETAAREMAPLIETPCWLIPIPASDGSTRANAILAPDFRLLPFPLRVNPCNPCLPSPLLHSSFFLPPSPPVPSRPLTPEFAADPAFLEVNILTRP